MTFVSVALATTTGKIYRLAFVYLAPRARECRSNLAVSIVRFGIPRSTQEGEAAAARQGSAVGRASARRKSLLLPSGTMVHYALRPVNGGHSRRPVWAIRSIGSGLDRRDGPPLQLTRPLIVVAPSPVRRVAGQIVRRPDWHNLQEP